MANPIDIEIKKILLKAPFSFVGTILRLNAGTMLNIPINEHTAVVQVDYVLNAPAAFVRMAGQRITLQLAENKALPAAGDTLAFFTDGFAFGESIAVLEIERMPVTKVKPYIDAVSSSPGAAFNDLVREIQEDALLAHMRSADALVLGTVVAMHKDGPTTRSEHDPDWWVATINVYHVEKGELNPGDLKVLYANSSDVRWFSAPKCSPSQGGLWILHRTSGDFQNLAPFEIKHPEDFQVVQALDLYRRTSP